MEIHPADNYLPPKANFLTFHKPFWLIYVRFYIYISQKMVTVSFYSDYD